MDGRPIINQLNNGILSSKHAMPQKDVNSDNGESFAIDRTLFLKSYQPPVNYSLRQTTRSFFQRRSPAIEHGFVVDGPKSSFQKKWMNTSRDSSSVTMNRRMNTTGAVLQTPGPFAFKNTEKNSRIEALTRVRGGGARVPPKVCNRPVTFNPNPPIPYYQDHLRIISAGLSATDVTSRCYVTASGSANGIPPGIYLYNHNTLAQTPLVTRVTGVNVIRRSYNVMTIDKITGEKVFTWYDVYGTSGQDAALSNYLNALPSSVYVIVSTFDEPKRDASTSPPNAISSGMITAMQRCGATANFGSANGTPAGFIQSRGAYLLVGVPGMGVGNGLEFYNGAAIPGGDPNAFIDLRLSIFGGNYTGVSCNVAPN